MFFLSKPQRATGFQLDKFSRNRKRAQGRIEKILFTNARILARRLTGMQGK
jgi:hypothetical protein